MNNVQSSNIMMMNNSNNQNQNSNDFPNQSNIAQLFNQKNNNNPQMMMNNNMNNNMMNNMNMNNNMGMNNNMNGMNMMNNNMGMNNNMNSMNNMNRNNMGMNNMGKNNNMNGMNMMNNNMGMNNPGRNNMFMNNMNRGMNNNMNLMNNNMGMKNINMGMNNMNNMNNMALVRYNPNNFQINWYKNNFYPNNMNSQNNMFIMKMLHNQMQQKLYFQMIFQQRMFLQMQKNLMLERTRKMQEILNNSFNNNNDNNNNNFNNGQIFNLAPQIQNDNTEEDNYIPNQALLDVIQEPNPPQQNLNIDQNMNNPILPSELVSEVIADVMNLNPDLLSGLGNNLLGQWAQGENRGGRPYKPPNGWIGYGLNVLNKYDNGNNDWLACNGRPGEWCIAYHGACNGQSSDNVKIGIKSILETNLRPGGGQAYQSHDDANHPGQKVGVGVYCSPEPSVIDGYSGIMNINGHNYKAAFMLRVKPDKIRYSASRQDYWVVNGDFSELRPYRLLIRPC